MAPLTRPNWSRSLPRPLVIPGVMTLRTLADVKELLRHLPKEVRARSTWQRIAALVDDAARGGTTPTDVTVALELVLIIEKVTFRPAQNGKRTSP
jgi:hypothetical protein